MKRKYSIIILAFLILIFLVYLSINYLVVPSRIKPLITETINNYTGKKAEIEKINFSLFQGLIIRNLAIPNLLGELPLKFSRINLSIKYFPLIFQKKLVYHLTSSPAEIINIHITSQGIFKLSDKSLISDINIEEFPIILVKLFIEKIPLEIKGGKTNLAIKIQIDNQKNILADIEIPLREISLNILKHSLWGNANLSLQISKPIKSKRIIYRGKTSIDKMQIEIPGKKENILFSAGDIDFDAENIQIHKVNCKYLENTYLLAGKVAHLHQPEIDLELSSEKIMSKMELSSKEGSLEIKRININLPQSNLELRGLISDLKDLNGDIYLSGYFNTQDIEFLPFNFFSEMKKLTLNSNLNIETYISGSLKQWNNLTSLIKINSPVMEIKQYKMENIKTEINTENGFLNAVLEANTYGGDLRIDIKDLALKESFPFVANLILDELDLKKLNKISLKSGKNIAGIFHGELNCRGEIKNLKEIAGEGWFEITEGLLWELPVFNKLRHIIEIPGVEKNVFKEAHANFIIKNQTITTRDLELLSKRLTLKTQGSISFNGNLDLKVRMEFPQESEEKLETLDKLQDILLKGAGSLIKEIQIKGTLKNPEYKILPTIENIFQNILQ